jgi:hypothetical protein
MDGREASAICSICVAVCVRSIAEHGVVRRKRLMDKIEELAAKIHTLESAKDGVGESGE